MFSPVTLQDTLSPCRYESIFLLGLKLKENAMAEFRVGLHQKACPLLKSDEKVHQSVKNQPKKEVEDGLIPGTLPPM